MKKKMVISAVSVFVLALATYLVLANTYFSPYETQLRLAYKYLDEGNYTEAILAFDKAIEIDAKKPKAYIGKAEVYIVRGDENAIADATAVLKLGYEQASDNNRSEIVDAVIKLSDMLKDNGKDDLAYEFAKIMYEIIKDDKIADWMVDYLKDYVKNPESSDGKFFVDTFKDIYYTTGSDSLLDWLKDYAADIFDEDDFEFESEIFDLLDFMYEETKDEEIEEIIEENIEVYGVSVLKELYDSYMAGDETPVIEFVKNENPRAGIQAKIPEGSYIWYSESDSLENAGTSGIALYYNGLVYIGEWSNNKFNGSGVYYGNGDVYKNIGKYTSAIGSNEFRYMTFKGTFVNGTPNGQGEETHIYQNETGGTICTDYYSGNYANALKTGIFKYDSSREDGKVFKFSLNYTNGVAQKIGNRKHIGDFSGIAQHGITTSFHRYTGETEYAPGYSSKKMSY